VTFKVRYEDFDTHTKSKTLPLHTPSIKVVRQLALEWVDFALEDVRKIRLVGISVHNLRKKSLNPSLPIVDTWNQLLS
jgi:nucleotidyltransferase/DNA polymerase involved in DNA repair